MHSSKNVSLRRRNIVDIVDETGVTLPRTVQTLDQMRVAAMLAPSLGDKFMQDSARAKAMTTISAEDLKPLPNEK